MPQVTVMENVLSLGQAAACVGVSWQRIDQLCRTGELPYILTPVGRIFRREDVDELNRQRAERKARRRSKAATSAGDPSPVVNGN